MSKNYDPWLVISPESWRELLEPIIIDEDAFMQNIRIKGEVTNVRRL